LLRVTELTFARRNEVIGIGRCLRLQYAIDRNHKVDQIGHSLAAFVVRNLRIFAGPFKLVHYGVLAFFLPVINECEHNFSLLSRSCAVDCTIRFK
jgi:hypothetical protein